MSWRKGMPAACALVLALLCLIQLVESQCSVGSNFNPNSCGVCNFVCLSAPNTIARCTNGLCDCAAGWANCDGNNNNGCETPIPSNLVGFRCYGTGRNGKLDVNGGRLLGQHRTGCYGSGGTPFLGFISQNGIFRGDLVIIHQTQRSGAIGAWEYNRVADISGSTFILEANLMRDYNYPGAQVVAVAEFTDAVVDSGYLYGPNWDGIQGGILPMMVQGTLTASGGYDIYMDGAGFRGQYGGSCPRRCTDGIPGEGHTGIIGSPSRGNVGSGGGGGGKGRDCGFGASGGYAGFGGSAGSPNDECSDTGLGSAIGGSAVGGSNLRSSIFLGGAGGEGGADEDGSHAGGGGNGGGIIIIHARQIVLNTNSEITADGLWGGDGDQSGCGGGGCGMAGGGGGAGGGIRLVSSSISGGGAVTAQGGGGGLCTCTGYGRAPTGSNGRTEAGPGSVSLGFSPGFSAPA